jgi:hypothetical protein
MGEGAGRVKKAGGFAGRNLRLLKRGMAKDSNNDPETARQQRLAAALRANLARRKARDRTAGNEAVPAPPQGSDAEQQPPTP